MGLGPQRNHAVSGRVLQEGDLRDEDVLMC